VVNQGTKGKMRVGIYDMIGQGKISEYLIITSFLETFASLILEKSVYYKSK
jgi:hypothetical protein